MDFPPVVHLPGLVVEQNEGWQEEEGEGDDAEDEGNVAGEDEGGVALLDAAPYRVAPCPVVSCFC